MIAKDPSRGGEHPATAAAAAAAAAAVNNAAAAARRPSRMQQQHQQQQQQQQQHKVDDDPTKAVRQATPSRAEAGVASPDDLGRRQVPASLRPGMALPKTGDAGDEDFWEEARAWTDGAEKLERTPDSLKPGGGGQQINPYLRTKPETEHQGAVPQHQEAVPPEASFAKMSLDDSDQSSNPWQTDTDSPTTGAQSLPPLPARHALPEGSDSDPWSGRETLPASHQQPAAARSPAMMSLPSEDEPTWDDGPRHEYGKPPAEAPRATPMSEELLEDQHVWDDVGASETGKGKDKGKGLDLDPDPDPGPDRDPDRDPDLFASQQAQLDDWNFVDAESSSNPSKQAAEEATEQEEERPQLPPRQTDGGQKPKWVASRQPVDGKSETYQVKKIRWHDENSAKNPRTSPILVQNKNGPCPLVALVNALTLTTPADMPDTALAQVLRSREQVSLSLLLDAVFDELMSPRRTSSDDALPDVSDLYSFLQSLHTGMNVNPRFVPTPEMLKAYQHTSLTHLDPAERKDLIPGTFENTAEMDMYATFSIPLIHGWLPPRKDAAYEALERRAASYEEAQNLLFREEELEEKLSSGDGGLSDTEAELYQDIMTIKNFLTGSATQLTPRGIEVIAKAMPRGSFAILFRNDHFSTLYCHPQTAQLLSLVTDAGYGSHEEVVWESLVDVNGERTEYLSGDFQMVGASPGHGHGTGGTSRGGQGAGEWTTAQSRRSRGRQRGGKMSPSPKHEQEDRDLALALQLQEEEEQQHRAAQARRQRESMLSEQFIEQQSQRAESVSRTGSRRTQAGVAERLGGNGGGTLAMLAGDGLQPVRSLVPPARRPVPTRRPGGEAEEAPPSYEQAAQDKEFVPPAGHPSHADSTVRRAPRPGSQVILRARRRAVSPGAALGAGSQGRGERDCVVM